GRCPTDGEGRFVLVTRKPPPQPPHAPHLALSVLGRGLVKRLATRLYFGDEAEANGRDPVLAGIADPAARDTLVARPTAGGYHLDIRLQGDGETVFFDV